MKKIVVILISLSSLFVVESCSKKPYACFKTDIDEDSIHVNQVVTFDPSCSSNAADFYWEFYGDEDSFSFSRNVEWTFYDTGNVKVYLLVTNGNKLSSITREIRINP